MHRLFSVLTYTAFRYLEGKVMILISNKVPSTAATPYRTSLPMFQMQWLYNGTALPHNSSHSESSLLSVISFRFCTENHTSFHANNEAFISGHDV
jgi:hypothetical protein